MDALKGAYPFIVAVIRINVNVRHFFVKHCAKLVCTALNKKSPEPLRFKGLKLQLLVPIWVMRLPTPCVTAHIV